MHVRKHGHSSVTGVSDMPIWFYNLSQSLLLLITFALIFMVCVAVTNKVPMKVGGYVSAFGVGLILAIILHVGATILGSGFTKGVLGALNKHNITINYKESRTSTLGEDNGQRSREH